MNDRAIKNLNKRQFEKTLQREGQSIEDYYTHATTNVFFRQMKHSDGTNTKLRIYYDKDASIQKGTVFSFMGDNWLVINKDAIESDVYNTSVAIKTTQNLVCNNHIIPFVVSDLKNVYPVTGSMTSLIGGGITMYTGDNTDIRKVKVNDYYEIFGGTYVVINNFFNDGLGYIYLKRDLDNEGATPTLEYIGPDTFQYQENATVLLRFVAKRGTAIIGQNVLTYATSNSSIATVNKNGVMTIKNTGEVYIWAYWNDNNLQCRVKLTISANANPDDLVYASITHSGDEPKIRLGGGFKTLTAHFWRDDTEIEYRPGTWSFTINGVDISDRIVTKTITDDSNIPANSIKVKVPNDNNQAEDLLGEIINVTFQATGSDISASINIQIISL